MGGGAEDVFGPGYFFIRDTTMSSYLDIINAYNRIYPVLDFCSGKLGPGIIFQENLSQKSNGRSLKQKHSKNSTLLTRCTAQSSK